MAVTEHLMKPGSFEITLDPATPKAVRSALVEFGHIVIFDTPFDPRLIGDGTALAAALYIGVMRRKPTPFKLTGAHVLIWLGDEEGKATLATITLTAGQTFVQLVTTILASTIAVAAGTLTAVGATLAATNTLTNANQRAALDFVMTFFGGEYRVRGDAANNVVCDAGPSSAIFSTTPKVIATPFEGGRELSGLLGIASTAFDFTFDADSYATAVQLGIWISTTHPGGNPYKDLRGNVANLTYLLSGAAPGNETNFLIGSLPLHDIRREFKLSTLRYGLTRDLRAGDWLYVFDPINDVVDTANQVVYRGEMINPMALRAFEITWPVEQGMSVFYRDRTGVYTDLTRYVVFDPPGATLQVGAPVRGLTVP